MDYKKEKRIITKLGSNSKKICLVIFIFFTFFSNQLKSQLSVESGYIYAPECVLTIGITEPFEELPFPHFNDINGGYLIKNKFNATFNFKVSYSINLTKNKRLLAAPEFGYCRFKSQYKKLNANKYTFLAFLKWKIIEKQKFGLYVGSGYGRSYIHYKSFKNFEHKTSFTHEAKTFAINFATTYAFSPTIEAFFKFHYEYFFVVSKKYIYWNFLRQHYFNNFTFGVTINLRNIRLKKENIEIN